MNKSFPVHHLRDALELWDNGFSVIPLYGKEHPPTPDNPSKDPGKYKRPTLKWAEYQNTRAKRDSVLEWFSLSPFLNIGIITTGLIIIDADNSGAVNWCDQYLNARVIARTAKGKHYYFRQPSGFEVRNSVNKEKGIDLRASGGYVVAPPSIHGSGFIYEWLNGQTPSFSEINELDRETFENLQRHLEVERKNSALIPSISGVDENKCLSSHQEDLSLPAELGERNDHLARITGSLLAKGFSPQEILNQTTEWNSKNPEPLPDNECSRTIKSIIGTDDRNNLLKLITGTKGEDYPQRTLEILDKQASRGERGAAEMLLGVFRNRILFNHDSGHWLNYKNGVWVKDTIKNITWEAQGLLVDIFSKSAQVSLSIEFRLRKKILDDNEEREEVKKGIKKFQRLKDLFFKSKNRFSQKNAIDHILDLLSTENEMGCGTLNFDTDPILLNLRNGYYNLETQEFKASDPSKKFQVQARVSFDPNAKAEKWMGFLELIFEGDRERIRYTQKLVGISLSGRSDFQAVLFCFGDGKNGKSTFIETLSRLFGDYFGKITSETLLARGRYGSNASDYDMADLFGKRMVVGDELSRDRAFNESLLKNLTGGDMIKARQPREKFVTFQPTHTLWMFGNHKPRVSGTDEGIWRRMKLIPFEYRIPDEELRDQRVLFEEFERELPGILNWALEGYRLYLKEGAREPESVKRATLEYREDSDTLGRFLEERCVESSAKVGTSELYQAYVSWCSNNSERQQYFHQKGFTQALKAKGYRVAKGSGRKSFLEGYQIMEEEEALEF